MIQIKHAGLLFLVVAAACTPTEGEARLPEPISATNHPGFPIGPGSGHAFGRAVRVDGVISCESCHAPDAGSFTELSCTGCHQHPAPLVDRLHLGEAGYEPTSRACYQCHPAGEKVAFSHALIPPDATGRCAECHADAAPFSRLPLADGGVHLPVTSDCGACHQRFDAWQGATGLANGLFDPAHDWAVVALAPTFSGTRITRVTPAPQQLHMPMNHEASGLDAGVVQQCEACHFNLGGDGGTYFPGVLHSALENLGVPQPSLCLDCHRVTEPEHFVGALAAGRSPQTGAMRHDARGWDGGARLSPLECAVCHASPSRVSSSWSIARSDGGAPVFHASLTQASLPQPGSCLECHAHSRPTALLSAPGASLPAGLVLDHDDAPLLGDCVSCHVTSDWAPGRFHLASATPPATCLPCHAQERPTSFTGWVGMRWVRSPFDRVTNDAGIGHGGGEDCVACHAASTSTWVGGHFPHGPGTLAATTCSACHLSQRPAQVVQGFDHALAGMGECRACHQATVTAGRYLDYLNPNTGALPGGDWKGGRDYPGDVLVTSPTQFISITQYTLQRAPPDGGLVTGMTSQRSTFFNAMLHTSSVIPAQVFPGANNTPNPASCWHCHANVDGGVTSYLDGEYHAALTRYAATPGGAVTPLPQPTTQCLDCHEPMRPGTLVLKSDSPLFPMDHSARFAAPVLLGGRTVSSVAEADCSVCHDAVGVTWSDGLFHSKLAGASPAECVSCHWPLSASTSADVASGATFTMKHRSTQLTFQRCETCHPNALGKASTTPATAALWNPGALHPHAQPQPAACLDCHASSEPSTATQGTETWTFTRGGTPTNGAQWMNHAVAAVTSRDCAACHASDAKPSGSAWSKATRLHSNVTATGACASCHGTSNGRGTVIGTNNNLPLGLTDSDTLTTAVNAPGVFDQLDHADVNVSSRDCAACHALASPLAWKGSSARFHASFTGGAALVLNGTTGRCSTCHLNVRPALGQTTFDHTGFSAAPGTQDCAVCHAYPGTSATTPNWKGATAVPQFISVGGFTVPVPPATSAGTLQAGITNLPHPAATSCTACHPTNAGGRRATGYDHASTLINTRCNACHEAGSDLVSPAWNGATTEAAGLGDTRPFTLPSVRATYKGNSLTVTYAKHFWPIDCAQCHVIPTGNGTTTTGTAYQTAWRFPHTESRMTNPSTCLTCHTRGVPN